MKWTAKAPEGVTSWDQVRFKADAADYRPLVWPPLGPYWCSGYDLMIKDGEMVKSRNSIVVAFVPHGTDDADLKKYWPEAENIERMQQDVQITYSERFVKPDWWIE